MSSNDDNNPTPLRDVDLSSKIEEVKLAGSKRFGLFWAIL